MHTLSLSSSLPNSSSGVESVGRAPSPRIATREFNSRNLFGDAQEVRIEHYGQEYRLRQTRNGKLILTK